MPPLQTPDLQLGGRVSTIMRLPFVHAEPKVVVKKAAPYCPYEDVEDFQSAPKGKQT